MKAKENRRFRRNRLTDILLANVKRTIGILWQCKHPSRLRLPTNLPNVIKITLQENRMTIDGRASELSPFF